MVQIVYTKNRHCLTVTGHAGAGKKGNDIVCAAISVLVLTLAENVRALANTGTAKAHCVQVREGEAKIRCTPVSCMDAVVQCIFESVCCGFEVVQQMYPDHVDYQCI